MNRILHLILLCAVFSNYSYSQCIPINPQPGLDCSSAPFLCCGEVDGLAGTLPDFANATGPTPLCPGNPGSAPNNTEWVSFAAGSTSITLELTLSNCTVTGQGAGAQVGIYSDCGFTSTPFCQGNQLQNGTHVINLNNLVIGEVYHLFIDGWSGSVCDYSFDVTAGSTVSPEPQNPAGVTGPTSVCEGATGVSFSAPLGQFSNLNNWTIDDGSVQFNDNGSSITITDWGTSVGGTVTICAEGLNDCFLNPDGITGACITVQVNADQMQTEMGTYCSETGGFFFPPTGQSYPEGNYTLTVPDPNAGIGCDITYDLTVQEFIPVDLDSFFYLCPGEPYLVNGTPYWPPLSGLSIPFGVDNNFCQRNLNLTLEAIDTANSIQANPSTAISCDNPNILLTAVVDNFNPSLTYTYTWDTQDGNFVSASDQTAIVNQPGTYTMNIEIEAFDDRGLVICNAIESSIVITLDTGGPDLSSSSQTPSSCGTVANGSATVNPSGATPPYSYLWNDPLMQTGPTAIGLSAGVYQVEVTDATGCASVTTVEVFSTPVVDFDASPMVTNINCFNTATGEATVNATGGTGTIDYNWNVGAITGPTATGLSAGTYEVYATDQAGCADTLQVTITQPTDSVSAIVVAETESACGQSTGSIDITASGGSAPYSYNWSNMTMNEDLLNASAGVYVVTVTDDLGCEVAIQGNINNSSGPTDVTIAVTDVSCLGLSDGGIDLGFTGGLAPFNIDWDQAPDVEDPSGLTAGDYNVTVTDDNGCSVTGATTINEPALLEVGVNATLTECNGSTGQLFTTVTGGSTVDTYMWDGGASAVADPQGLSVGTYNVTVTDINGCIALGQGMIAEPAAPQGTSAVNDVSCFDANDGSITISMTSAGTFTYAWSDPALDSNSSNSNLAPNTYSVTVTDQNNCTEEFSETIIQPTAITGAVITTATECFGQNNGQAEITPTGGSGTGYMYQWCSGEDQSTANMLLAGACSVTVSDDTGCEVVFPFNIDDAPVLDANVAAVVDLACNNDGLGAIDLNVQGGTGNLEYNWTGGTIGTSIQDPTNLEAGIYTVEIEDDNGCTVQVTNIQVNEPAALQITSSTDDASCNLSNGTIEVNVSGGTGTIDYNWTPTLPNSGSHLGTVASGTYFLEIEDDNGCLLLDTVEVLEPNALAVASEVGSMLSCFGDSDGTASVVINGGSAPYTYDWGAASPDDSPSISGLSEGTYNVEVTDFDGCIINASATVAQPSAVAITLVASVDPACDAATGSIDITASGGTVAGDYSYEWNGGTFSTEDISSLLTGNYIIEVTDDNGCTAQESFGIQAPNSFSPEPTGVDVTCNGQGNGSISIAIPDGSGDFTYAWSSPAIGNTPNATNLTPNLYTVTITDNVTGCINSESVDIVEPLAIALSGQEVDPSCLNNNGSISASISGGTGMLGLNWTGPNSFSASTASISNLEAGDYVLEVLDSNNCPANLLVTLELPELPMLSVIPSNVVCFGENTGSIQALGTTVNGSLIYNWSDPAITGNPQIATGLSTGVYNVTITDDESCTAEVLNISITEPPLVTLSSIETLSDCDVDNGSINLTPGGGVGMYTYAWSDPTFPATQSQMNVGPGNYTATVFDGNGCEAQVLSTVSTPNAASLMPTITDATCFNENSGSISLMVNGTNGPYNFLWDNTNQMVANPTNLGAGTYSVTVSDNDGCETFGTYDILEGTEIIVSAVPSPALCSDPNGSIALTIDSGTGPFTFDWADPAVADIANPTGLTNGQYEVTVYDANNCSFTDTYILSDPAATQTITNQDNNDCFQDTDGQASIEILAGSAPYDITWTDDTGTVISTTTLNANGPDQITGLAAGTYTVEILDANGCPDIRQFIIEEPTELVAVAVASQASVSCFGDMDGSAIAQPSGGTAPYSFLWNDGNNSNTAEVFGLGGDQTYNVIITDDNGCTEEADISIDEPELFVATESFTGLDCKNDVNATISITTAGGNSGTISYDWNQNQYDNLSDLTGLGAGTYIVTVTDSEGCSDEKTIDIIEPAGIELDVVGVSQYEAFNVSCFGFEDGSIDISATGGTNNLEYLWNDANASTTQDLNGIGAGEYTLLVTDENGCTEEIMVPLDGPSEIEIEFEAIDVRCAGDANGAVIVTNTSGGAGPYMFGIDEGPLGTGVFNGLPAGEYVLQGEDANGCPTESTLTIEEPDPLEVDLGDEIELEFGDSITLIPDIALGGASLSSLEWGNQDVLCPDGNCLTLNVKPENTTTYRVTVIDENGCLAEDNIVVRVRKDRNVYIPNVFNPNSDVGNNVFQLYTGRGVTMVEEFIVVDRWGEIVFRIPEAFDPSLGATNWGWDGTLNKKNMNPGVYVYYAKVRFLDNEVIEYAGDVTLLK